MPSLNQFFHRRMTSEYNCLDHTREIWLYLKGEDLKEVLPGLSGSFRSRSISHSRARRFVHIEAPESPCIVVMQRPGARETSHVGVYYKGSVMQISEAGVEYQPLPVATRSFSRVRFYK